MAANEENLNNQNPDTQEDIFAEEDVVYDPGDSAVDTEETGDEKEAGEAEETGNEKETGKTEEAGETKESPEAEASEESAQEADRKSDDTKDEAGASKKRWREKKKDKKDEQIEELTDKVRRQMAEFDNFRKRTEKEKSQMFEMGAKSIIEKLLPVVDNFERGIAALTEEEKGTGFADGMEKVYKQLMTMLEEAGVTPIEAVGKEFDPNLHNAVMHIEDENLGENVVAQEFQKGYMYRDTVVRHSMVQVAN